VAVRKPFLLRIDAAVLESMQRWANDDLRSLNGQVEYVLREALRRGGRLPREPMAESLPSESATGSAASAPRATVPEEDPAPKSDDSSS
jgi:hypothetical protein